MKLFKDIIISKKLINFKIEDFEDKIEIIKKWHSYYKTGTLKQDKEKEVAPDYTNEIFINLLGYKGKTSDKTTFTSEYSLNGKFPDGVIGILNRSKKEDIISAVVELKGAGISLDQPQKREKNYTPIEQAFGYKRQLRNCPFVIVSNFFELRLYNDNELDYELWTLEDLINPENDYFNFRKFYYLLSEKNLISEIGISNTESLLSEIRVEEEEITKKFYKDYKEKRHYLLQNLFQKNEILRNDPDLLVEKGQKIIDRIIFICFAEDIGLLPADLLANILSDYNKSTISSSLKDTLNQAFNSIDKGNEKWEIPDGYNGGLFKNDQVLNDLKVDDSILAMVIDFGKYDFAEQLSVTILGHIFEQSISDLEEIKEKIKEKDFVKNDSGKSEIKKVSKRKKDGIFYTPEYIVDYIVKNSLGKYLREKETEIIEKYNFDRESLKEITRVEKKKRAYSEYQEFLKTVKVLDPACGSGAFLVRVFDYLLEENRRVGKVLGTLFDTDETYKNILQNNIYGVDLNQESVEITKLSLWLKSAQPGKKLSNLDQNIKCGNSLIDDPEVAGDRAFKWEEEFSEIVEKGGFDIIIGNPPYVRQELLAKKDKEFLSKKYESGNGTADLYVYFYEKGLNLLKRFGKLAFITPNKFYKTKYGKDLRKFLKQYDLISLVDFFELPVFEDASTDSQILVIEKNNIKKEFTYSPIKNLESFKKQNYKLLIIEKENLSEDIWVFYSNEDLNILNKMKENSISLKKYTNDGIEYGIKTGLNEAFIIDKKTRDEIINNDIKSKELIKPYLSGKEINKWNVNFNDKYIIITFPAKEININDYSGLEKYFREFGKIRLEQSGEAGSRKKTKNNWFETQDTISYYDKFDEPKIIYIHTAVDHKFYFDEEGYYINNSCYLISNSDKFLSVWLNSKIFSFYKNLNFVAYGDSSGGGRVKLDYNKMVNVPVPIVSEENKKPFVEKADLMLELNKRFYDKKTRFIKRIQDNYDLEKVNKKLDKFYEMDFGDFVKELRKQKAIVPLSTQDELEEYFEKNKKELFELESSIEKTDKEINQVVYKLYNLTDSEIKIIENS